MNSSCAHTHQASPTICSGCLAAPPYCCIGLRRPGMSSVMSQSIESLWEFFCTNCSTMVLFYFSLSTLFFSYVLTYINGCPPHSTRKAAAHWRRSYQRALLAPPVGHPAPGRDVFLRQRSRLAILAPPETKGRMTEPHRVSTVTPAATNANSC